MTKRRGGGGKSASRSAAAKKGWETRRNGGAAGKAKGTAPTKATIKKLPKEFKAIKVEQGRKGESMATKRDRALRLSQKRLQQTGGPSFDKFTGGAGSVASRQMLRAEMPGKFSRKSRIK